MSTLSAHDIDDLHDDDGNDGNDNDDDDNDDDDNNDDAVVKYKCSWHFMSTAPSHINMH